MTLRHEPNTGRRCLLGVVPTKSEPVPATDLSLGVNGSVVHNAFRIGRKPAQPGVTENAYLFDDGWFSVLEACDSAGAGQLDMDTSLWPDGDYDLILQAAIVLQLEPSTVIAEDLWDPTWYLDGNPDFDWDEKYLKTIGTWYDSDRDWKTLTDEGGKIITDNTPPSVQGYSPGPPP